MRKKRRRPQKRKKFKKYSKGSPTKKPQGKPKVEDDSWEIERDLYLNQNT